MSLLLPFWILPIVFVMGCLALAAFRLRTGWRRAGLYGLLAFFVSFVLGALGILESRGSTSGIGFVFLPIYCLVPGLLGFAFGLLQTRYRLRSAANVSTVGYQAGLWLVALGLISVLSYQGLGWYETRQLNETRDAETQRQREAIRAFSDELNRLLAERPGEEAALIAELAAETTDRTRLIPLANSRFASAAVLDELSRSPDFGVALSALRNPNVTPESIVWVYRHHRYPDYFFSNFAAHPATPAWILTELYSKRAQNTGIPRGLIQNPNTPPEIRDRLAEQP